MKSIEYSEFTNKLNSYFDDIEHSSKSFVIKRKSRKGVVIMPMKEYNSLVETAYLLSSPANAQWLYDSIKQMKKGHSLEEK